MLSSSHKNIEQKFFSIPFLIIVIGIGLLAAIAGCADKAPEQEKSIVSVLPPSSQQKKTPEPTNTTLPEPQVEEKAKQEPSDKQRESSGNLNETEIYKQVTQTNTIDAYQEYLDQFPDGEFVEDARSKLELARFEGVREANHIGEYDEFLAQYPESPFVEQAIDLKRQRVLVAILDNEAQDHQLAVEHCEDNFKDYQEENTIDGYETYLKTCPGTSKQEEAISSIFALYLKDNTLAGYDAFYAKYPGSLVPDVIEMIFNLYKQQNVLEGYDQFLKTYCTDKTIAAYPQITRWKKEAISAILAIYQRQNTIEGYDIFLKKYSVSEKTRSNIIASIFVLYQRQNTIDGYSGFRSKYPVSHVMDVVENVFALYQQINTLKGYSEFLERYASPEMLRKYPAIKDYQQKAFSLVFVIYQKQNTLQGYEAFLDKYPVSKKLRHQAISAIYPFYQTPVSIQGYEEFLEKYPDNTPERKAALLIVFNYYRGINTIAGYEEFLKKYPNRIEALDAMFFLYKQKNSVPDYDIFLQKYPEIYRRVIPEVYAVYQNKNAIPGYRNFISKYPNTLQAVKALQRIHLIAFERAKKEDNYLILEEYQRMFPYSEFYDDVSTLAYQRELEEMRTAAKRGGGSANVLEEISKKKRLEARESYQRKEYRIAYRKYKLITRESPFSKTKIAKEIMRSGEVVESTKKQEMALSGADEETAMLKASVRMMSPSYKTGKTARMLEKHIQQIEIAGKQAKSRSNMAYGYHINLLKNRDDARQCALHRDWLCGRF